MLVRKLAIGMLGLCAALGAAPASTPLLISVTVHEGTSMAVAVSPDGRTLAVGAEDRDRDIALEAVLLRHGMGGKMRMHAGVTEYHRLMVLADLVAEGRFEHQFAAGFHAEIDLVVHRAGRPVAVGDACDDREPHAGGMRDGLQDGRNRGQPRDRAKVVGNRPVE